MHSDIAELLLRIAYVVVRSYCLTLCGYGCRRLQTLYCRTTLGLPFASCPGWETIRAAAVLLAAMVAAEYKTNHHFVRRGSSPEVKMSESKVQLQMVNVKYNHFHLHALYGGQKKNCGQWTIGSASTGTQHAHT